MNVSTTPHFLGIAIIATAFPAAAQTATPVPSATAEAAPNIATAAPSTASAITTNAAPKAAAPAPIKIGKNTTLSILLRTRIENNDYFQGTAAPGGDAGDGKYTFLGNLLRVGVLNATPRRDIQLEISQPTLLGLPDNATALGAGTAGQGQLGLGATYFAVNGRRNDASVFLKQAFVRFKGLRGAPGNSFRLGRFEFIDGTETMPKDATLAFLKRERIAHRLIGNFGFSHVQRSFDGAQLVLGKAKNNFTFAALRPTAGVFDLDANGDLSGVSTLYAAWTKPAPKSDLRVFAAYYRDSRDEVVKVDNRPLAARAADQSAIGITTLGAHYLKTAPWGSGSADLLFWGALQGGKWGEQNHRAGALALEAGYQRASTRWKPWLRVGYFKSSGDGDATDNRHQTFFQVLPTPRIYARVPFYNLMNNQDAFAQLILRPNPKTTIRADAHRISLGNRNDLLYSGGGTFQGDSFGYAGRPSFAQSGVADVFDISFDRQIGARTALSLYLGVANGRGVISKIYAKKDTARFGFIEVTQKF